MSRESDSQHRSADKVLETLHAATLLLKAKENAMQTLYIFVRLGAPLAFNYSQRVCKEGEKLVSNYVLRCAAVLRRALT